MIKHYINYLDNIYYIEIDEKIVFSVELKPENKEVIIRSINSNYEGKIEDIFINVVDDK